MGEFGERASLPTDGLRDLLIVASMPSDDLEDASCAAVGVERVPGDGALADGQRGKWFDTGETWCRVVGAVALQQV
ncbi:hypothetical protein [Gordonia sp. SCSIO 19800]|uniref:hypothetical protein n=1 Tax=Gordonia sp. SCSIO 19800 TaxID=2826926 RepID=UPI001B81B828|nr:hypothetical protein [Gordonia sp. SCSIO 19800]MBR7192877.1 hypothetical protein [Gordonia sp. SCSIO 19800]